MRTYKTDEVSIIIDGVHTGVGVRYFAAAPPKYTNDPGWRTHHIPAEDDPPGKIWIDVREHGKPAVTVYLDQTVEVNGKPVSDDVGRAIIVAMLLMWRAGLEQT